MPQYQRSLLALKVLIVVKEKKGEERTCALCSDGIKEDTHFVCMCICQYYKFQRTDIFRNKNINYTSKH